MKIALWIVQILLALAFLATGAMKLVTPNAELAAQMAWVTAVPVWVPRLAGAAEILGAIGLILPAATRIKPQLTPLAAAGLVVVMGSAIVLHLSLGEFGEVVPGLVLGSLAAFVAWGRSKKVVIPQRVSTAA